MIDYQRLYHTGIRVPDLDAAMAEMGETLKITWATVQHNPGQTVWTPDAGLQAVDLQFVYSCEGPQHIELLQGQMGTIWDAADHPGVHHVGVWVDDVSAETQRCLADGWRLAAAGLHLTTTTACSPMSSHPAAPSSNLSGPPWSLASRRGGPVEPSATSATDVLQPVGVISRTAVPSDSGEVI